ncbi:MAG: ABC transporter permease [Ruminococcaceae bacterium]|nr:ABC transporter permease [Oscillospiraceae bacterium]
MLIAFIQQSIRLSSTLLLGSTGEIITEKSGNLNLGTPGIMAGGAISGIVGAYFYSGAVETINPLISVIVTLLCSLLGSLFVTLIYCFLTINLKTNQNVTGLALTTFAVGASNFIGSFINSKMGGTGIAAFPEIGKAYRAPLPFADKLGWFGEIFLSYGFMTYLAIVIAIVVAFVITKTRTGLNLRAVGENPATADAAGINVDRYKYIATCLGGMISGLGGLCYVMDFAAANWQNNILDQFGWLSVALVIFAVWRPNIAIVGSIIFGALYVIGPFLLGLSNKDQELIKILPYLVTIIVLVIISIRDKKENQPPASLGVSYFREER